MHVVGLVLTVCWLAFWIFWLAAATGAKASRGRPAWRRFAGGRVALLVVIIFLLRDLGFRSRPAPGSPVLTGIGLALFAAGLALAIWARLYIGRNWGMPMSQRQEPDLVTTGPYRRVRHPIYSGIILALIGTALATTLYALIAAVILGGYFIYSATQEEAFLAREFPDAYPDYQHSTKMLVPFLF
ncbi:MAG TPA: isoprenylcysteine carboxylmethyltransferase family protein [Trebonia sp.]|nr:isoprenylcysteine carboxylmethyltransferase family protein [Trebonia sp.]